MRRYIFFLILIILYSCSPVRKYQSLPGVKSWESEIQAFEELDKDETYPDDAIIFAGSSSIKLWTTLREDMAPYHIIQRGYGGSKLSDYAVYAPRIFDPHKCSAIVIFIANDITGNKDDKTPGEVGRLAEYMLKTIRKNHPETAVFWIAITPTESRWKVWPQIQKANDVIKHICEKEGNAYFIKTDYAFLNEQGLPNPDLFVSDKLHLSPEGYKVWTRIIKSEISKVLPVTE